MINSRCFAQEQETERARIISEVAAHHARVHTLKVLAEDTQAEILKRAAVADGIQIQDIELTGLEVGELAKNARKPILDIRMDGFYRLLSVDSTDPDGFKVRVRNISNKDEFIAVVQDETLDKAYKTPCYRVNGKKNLLSWL